MSYVPETIGEVVGTRGESYFEWKIDRFFEVIKGSDNSFKSDELCFLNCRWHMKICPFGQDRKSEGWMNIYLHREDNGHPMSTNFTIGIKKADGEEEILCKEESYIFGRNFARDGGRSKCLRWFDLMTRVSELVPFGMMTITCTLESGVRHSVEGVNALVQSLKDLLLGGEYSDVVMKVEDRELKAHKAVLVARSPVFASMFEHDMKEKSCGSVDILDCTAEVFEAFLFYLYTGNMGVCLPDGVPLLYCTADKYGIEDLKVRCVEILKNSWSVDGYYDSNILTSPMRCKYICTFCDVVVLSLCHSEWELLEIAARFLCRNEAVIIESDEWYRFLQGHPIYANEIYMKSMKY